VTLFLVSSKGGKEPEEVVKAWHINNNVRSTRFADRYQAGEVRPAIATATFQATWGHQGTTNTNTSQSDVSLIKLIAGTQQLVGFETFIVDF